MHTKAHEIEVKALYENLLRQWNERNAEKFAECFSVDGNTIGFDGSQLGGRKVIADELGRVFSNHKTQAYVSKIREVKMLSADVYLLRAIVGMIPDGKTDINPAVNAIQTMVAKNTDGKWQIELFQNTPAQFHGRPELVEAMNKELRELL